jgi:hypothetical protein
MHYDTVDEFYKAWYELWRERWQGYTYLLKASHGMHFEILVERLKKYQKI